MKPRLLIFFTCVCLYVGNFIYLDNSWQNKSVELKASPPLKILKVTTGYFKHIVAEILFVKTSVFIGNINVDQHDYANNLAQNLKVMTTLYPEFKDPYYYTQSLLAPLSEKSADEANAILKTGIDTYSDNFVFRFFYAFNYYSYLNNPVLAAKAFAEAAAIKNAPPMFGHLAAVFSAHGGNINAGLIMLKSMYRNEPDEIVKKRYMEEILIFEKAVIIEKAIGMYIKDHKYAPKQLKDLIPDYLEYLPSLSLLPIVQDKFILVYEPPDLFLKRP